MFLFRSARIVSSCAAGSGPERLEYKLNFYRAFERQVRSLLSAGRHVIVVGDVNTAHRDVDIWAPAQYANTSGCLSEERRWMDGMIRSDLHRGVVEERKQMQLQAQAATAAGGSAAAVPVSDDFDSSFLTTLPLTAAAGGIVPASSLPDASSAGAAAAAASASAGTAAVAASSSSAAPAPAPLVDSFRYFNPFLRHAFTFWDMRTNRRESNLGWRIDYMLVDTALMLRDVCGANIHAAQKGSDHCPTSLQLRLPPPSAATAATTAAATSECDARSARIGSFLGLSPFPHPAPALAAKFRREFQVQTSTMLSFFRRAPSEPGAAVAKAAQEFTAAAAAAGGAATASNNSKKRKPTATSRARSLNSTLSAQQPSLAAMFAPSPTKKPKLGDQQQTAGEKKEPETIVIDEPTA